MFTIHLKSFLVEGSSITVLSRFPHVWLVFVCDFKFYVVLKRGECTSNEFSQWLIFCVAIWSCSSKAQTHKIEKKKDSKQKRFEMANGMENIIRVEWLMKNCFLHYIFFLLNDLTIDTISFIFFFLFCFVHSNLITIWAHHIISASSWQTHSIRKFQIEKLITKKRNYYCIAKLVGRTQCILIHSILLWIYVIAFLFISFQQNTMLQSAALQIDGIAIIRPFFVLMNCLWWQ